MSLIGKRVTAPCKNPKGPAKVYVTRLCDRVIAEYSQEGDVRPLYEIKTNKRYFEGTLIQVASRALRLNKLMLAVDGESFSTAEYERFGKGIVTHVYSGELYDSEILRLK